MIREHPGDRAVLGIRRRAYSARRGHEQRGRDDRGLAPDDRRREPWPRRSAASTATWPRPTRAGDRASAATGSRPSRAPIASSCTCSRSRGRQRQTGFTMRSHDNLLAQRAAGWDPVVVTALGFPRSIGGAVVPLEEVDGIRHHRLDLGAGYPRWMARSTCTSRTTPGAPRRSPARSGRPSSMPRRAGGATRRRSSGWRWVSTWICRSSTRSARCSTARLPEAGVGVRVRRDLDARTLSTPRRDRGAHDARRGRHRDAGRDDEVGHGGPWRSGRADPHRAQRRGSRRVPAALSPIRSCAHGMALASDSSSGT